MSENRYESTAEGGATQRLFLDNDGDDDGYMLLLLLCIFICRHHVYKKEDHKNIELSEVGPRFEMKCKL